MSFKHLADKILKTKPVSDIQPPSKVDEANQAYNNLIKSNFNKIISNNQFFNLLPHMKLPTYPKSELTNLIYDVTLIDDSKDALKNYLDCLEEIQLRKEFKLLKDHQWTIVEEKNTWKPPKYIDIISAGHLQILNFIAATTIGRDLDHENSDDSTQNKKKKKHKKRKRKRKKRKNKKHKNNKYSSSSGDSSSSSGSSDDDSDSSDSDSDNKYPPTKPKNFISVLGKRNYNESLSTDTYVNKLEDTCKYYERLFKKRKITFSKEDLNSTV